MSPTLLRSARRSILTASIVSAAATVAQAQVFVHQNGLLPEKVWSEGVECADVDNDGDLDIFFADGNGFASAGAEQQSKLYINQLEVAPLTFSDESVARLGVHVSNAKMVTTGDVDNDGWIDALFANAFNNRRPYFYRNQGSSNPGFFDFDNQAAGLVQILNSACANFGDLDNDGDLDIIINDSGNSFLGGGGDVPRLYINDGTGVFTQNAAGMMPNAKSSQMDVQFVDIDQDWDLDFFGPNRAGNGGQNHYLMLNDGAGNFTEVSNLLPSTGSNVYEAEPADLDGDSDADMFFTSLAGFSEGHIRNNLVPSGNLTFTSGSTLSGDDDNEVVLYDVENDGDYDVIIGSLGGSEKLFRNTGGLNFSTLNGAIQSISDSTLDNTVADLDNDGDYDLITAQGESNSNQWDNKIYVNGGNADTVAPVIVRQEPLSGLPNPNGPWVFRGEIRDQVLDDGRNWVSAVSDYVVLTGPETAEVSMAGFTFVPDMLTVPAGTTVTWDNPTFMQHTVTSDTPGYGFDSGLLNNGESFSYTFVRPGTYTYFCTPHVGFGMTGTIEVTGNCAQVDATYMNGQMYRFALTDTEAGEGTLLAYETRYTDWAGNVSVGTSVLEKIAPTFEQYGIGASPANTVDLAGIGTGQLGDPFTMEATNVTGVVALFGLSLGEANYPLLGGVGLIDPFQLVLTRLRAVNAGVSQWNLGVPNDSSLFGFALYFQASVIVSTGPDVWEHSNGVRMVIDG